MGLIECPVCTLYLRADMSLEEHLGTHPTDKVIKALVSMATKTQSPGSAQSPVPSPTTANTSSNPMELAMMAVASSSRPRTPPNALTYHSSGYESMKQEAPPPPPPPPAPIVPTSVPTAITVVKASDMGYPINNVMIVKSCSTKYVHQIPQSGGNSSSGGIAVPTGTAAFYPSGSVDGRNIFIEPDRGGPCGTLTPRRQIAPPSFYPRYTNERYSGPPPPYSTAISSTISASSQLQQSSMTGLVSKYEQKTVVQPQQQQQQSFCTAGPSTSAVEHTVPTIAITQQHHQQQQIYQSQPRPTPAPISLQQSPVAVQQQNHQHGQLQTTNYTKHQNILQAQYTEKDDGNFVVTENPKKVIEYTENDEGNFMVIEKIIKSPPRVVQTSDEMDLSSPAAEEVADMKTEDHDQEDEEPNDYDEMMIDEDEPYEVKDVEDEQDHSQTDTIEIIENEDGTFDDNRGCFGAKEMPKPMLINSIGSTKKCNKFNLFVESSPSHSGASSSCSSTPRKRPTSGLKVLSNVKVTTDLSQGIKDIILNLNSKNKTTNVTASNGSSPNIDGIQTSFIAGTKPTAVVNNNCQNELIINAGSNMPPIDLNNVNDIEIINDDEEDHRSDEEEECYVGSMEVKATSANAAAFRLEKDATTDADSSRSASRATPTPSVITSVIRMTPHSSPVVAPLTSPQPVSASIHPVTPTPTLTEPIAPPQPTKFTPTPDEVPSSSSGSPTEPIQKPPPLTAARKPLQTTNCSSGLIFNKPPKKLTVKLKTPLPPAPPPTPPLVSITTPTIAGPVVPKIELIVRDSTHEQHQEYQHSAEQKTGTFAGGENVRDNSIEAPSYVLSSAIQESKFIVPECSQLQSETHSTPTITGEGPSSDVTFSASSSKTVTTYITTKIEQDTQLAETVVFTQSSLNHDNSNCTVVSSPSSNSHENNQIQDTAIPTSSQEIVQTTTTTEVECFNITFIDDEGGVLNNLGNTDSGAMAIHEVIAQNLEISNDNCTTTIVEQDEEVDQKTNIASGCNIEITEVYALSPQSAPQVPSDTENVTSPAEEECKPADLKSRIKIENVEKPSQGEEENSANDSESTEEHRVAKIEPNTTVASGSMCSSNLYQNDQKDLLEAGPSREIGTVDSNSGSSAAHSRGVDNIEPTFLEYSAEYDDYVPVNGYGIPQEQIPLSWVQKFSPQYTPFDDQNSYMDLDMCSSKTNSNSVGENSATSGGSGSGSHGSHNAASMDRAPSAESLNIRTDEKMPAKGEISEQESNGDMELSWNRLYPVHENIPIYPSSYDLSTAQECWNLSNRHSSAHNNNSCSSNASNNHLAGPSDVAITHHLAAHPYHQGGHQSHGMSFQFAQHSENRNEADDQLDDKTKIRLDYGVSAEQGNYACLGPSGSGTLNDEASRKLVKIRSYRCTECPKSFATLKQRRSHILSEHETDSKVNVMGAAAVSATVTSGASSTVTSASALGFFSSPAASAGEGCSTSLLNKKIKIEPQPMLMSYSSLKQELEQKLEGGEVAGPSNAIVAGSSSGSGGEVRRKRTYVCCTCKQEFDRFKLFNAHLMTHPAECYACGRSFKHWPNFALHIKRHLGIKDHQCRLCGKKFVIKQKLIEHMRVHTGKAPIKCPDCDQHFRRFSNLAQHRNRHHLNKVPCKKDFVCDCGEVFQSKAKMEWHREIHENKPKSCPFCREKFIHKNSLTRHIRLSHTEKYVKLETATEMCTICNQPYIKTSMKRHMETHTDERMAFSCTICNKVFSTNWNLKQHRWTHANPTLKPFQCNMCSSGFVREADYITHMNAHKSIRPYTCNHCGCQFIRKYNWIRHTREHETDKNYTCEICGRKFHRKYYLTEHKRIHTGERPFSCNICGKTSSTKTNHNKHIKIHHARDPLTAEG